MGQRLVELVQSLAVWQTCRGYKSCYSALGRRCCPYPYKGYIHLAAFPRRCMVEGGLCARGAIFKYVIRINEATRLTLAHFGKFSRINTRACCNDVLRKNIPRDPSPRRLVVALPFLAYSYIKSTATMMCRFLFVALVVAMATAFNAGRMGEEIVQHAASSLADIRMSNFP